MSKSVAKAGGLEPQNSKNEALENIVRLLNEGAKCFVEAGKAYVKEIEKDPAFKDFVIENIGTIPAGIWNKLERVGRGLLSPNLMIPPPNGNYIARFSLAEQERCLSIPIDVYLPEKNDTLKVELSSMTTDQCRQVFACDHVRTIPEQRAFLESESTKRAVMKKSFGKPDKVHEVVKGKLKVFAPCEFTKDDLLNFLRSM